MYDEKILGEILDEFSDSCDSSGYINYNDISIEKESKTLYNIFLNSDCYEIRFFVSDDEEDIYNQSFVKIYTNVIFENIDSYGVLFGDRDEVQSEVRSLYDVTNEISVLFSYFTDACISVLSKYEYNEMFSVGE